MTATLERGSAGDGWAQGRVGNVVFLDFRLEISAEAVDCSFEMLTTSMERHPAGIALVAIFGERTRVPPAELRRRIADFLEPRQQQVLIGCTVIEGDSLSAKVKRAATDLVTALVKPPYGHRTLRTLGAACDFVASKAVDDAGARLSQVALLAAASHLRPVVLDSVGAGAL